MIELYTWGTANGRKLLIFLEEAGLAYRLHKVDISAKEQFAEGFVAISPVSKTPAIVDTDGPDGEPRAIFDSGAILIYLAEKTGQLPAGSARTDVLQWLMFEAAGLGPACAQAHHFLRAAPEAYPYAIDRYVNEVRRYYQAFERHMANRRFAAETFSIADIAIYPWVYRHEWHRADLAQFPNVERWFRQVSDRPAVNRAMDVEF